MDFDGLPPLKIDFDINSHLPTGLAKNQSQLGSPIQANLTMLSEENQNLTPSQKLLLEWHFRFGHKSMQSIQRYFRNVPFVGDRFKAAGKCICPRCATYEFAKGHRQPTKGNAVTINKNTNGSLRSEAMRAGQAISVDHFESRLLRKDTYFIWEIDISSIQRRLCLRGPYEFVLACGTSIGFFQLRNHPS